MIRVGANERLHDITKNKLVFTLILLFSAIASVCYVVGDKVHPLEGYMDGFFISDAINLVLMFLFFVLLVTGVLILCKNFRYTEPSGRKFSHRHFWGVAGLILFCFMPYFLTFYPGSITTDSFSSLDQALGGQPFSNTMPVLYSVGIKLCLKVGSLFGGIRTQVAVYSLTQMLLMALGLSAICEWIRVKGMPKIVRILALVFFCLNSVIGMYSITMWKDVLFSLICVLYVLYIYDIVECGTKNILKIRNLIAYIVFALLISFARNNGIYVVILTTAAFLFLGKGVRVKFGAIAGVLIALIMVIQGPVYAALGIAKSPFAESVGVPLQQIGYTVKTDGSFTPEEKAFIEQIMTFEDIKEDYTPDCSNGIKFSPDFNGEFLEQHKGEFLKTWATVLLKNPVRYVKGYFFLTCGYWHTEIIDWRCSFGPSKSLFTDIVIPGTNVLDKALGIDISSRLIDYIDNQIDQLFLVKYLFRVAFPVWVMLLACIVLIYKKNAKQIAAMLPIFGIWATLLIATPVYCEFRYMFAGHLALPILFTIMLRKTPEIQE